MRSLTDKKLLNTNNYFVTLKDDEYLSKLKHSGKVVAKCLENFKSLVNKKTPKLNLLDIESECEKIIKENNCIPTFKGYKGFPSSVCLSVNKELVHGIPKNYILQDGDIVTLDLGANTECGVIADAAVSVIYGTPKLLAHQRMLNCCQEALQKGIDAVEIGKQIGCIGNAIYKYTLGNGFSLITEYGGHGLERHKLHAQPFISNKSKYNKGIRVYPGLTVAIEPMLVLGVGNSKTSKKDKWEICSKNLSVHFEHTIFVTDKGVEIVTKI